MIMDGVILTILGMTVVFVFLTILYKTIEIFAALMPKEEPPVAAPRKQAPAAALRPAAAAAGLPVTEIIVAAVAAHRAAR
jgi:sodium pump decarboxylase gamma subunit